MSETAHRLDQEYWHPPVQAAMQEAEARVHAELCPRCNTEFIVGSRFCYVCGTERDPHPQAAEGRLSHMLDFHIIKESLGLTIPSLVAFIVGLLCLGAAVATGFLYTATTLLDWQAVQIWRIEWLLAAAVSLVAGVLLKRTGI